MSETNWTPGPWEIKDRGKKYGDMKMRGFVGSNGQCFAYTVGLSEPKDKANAHLIAAAPDLYASLVVALEYLGTACGCLPEGNYECNACKALAALAKARGES